MRVRTRLFPSDEGLHNILSPYLEWKIPFLMVHFLVSLCPREMFVEGARELIRN